MSEWKTVHCNGEEENTKITHKDVTNTYSLWWRIANIVIALFFGLSTAVQLNDPDAAVWMLLYGVPCILCLSAAISPSIQDHSVWKAAVTGHLGACICGSIYLIAVLYSTVDKKSYNPLFYEEGRELGGVGIVTFWLAICKIVQYRKSTNQQNSLVVVMVMTSSLLPLALWIFYFVSLMKNIDLPNHCKTILMQLY